MYSATALLNAPKPDTLLGSFKSGYVPFFFFSIWMFYLFFACDSSMHIPSLFFLSPLLLSVAFKHIPWATLD